MTDLSPETLERLHDGELIRLVSQKDKLTLQVRRHDNTDVTINAVGVRAFLASGLLNYVVIENVTLVRIDHGNEQALMKFIELSRHPVSGKLIESFLSRDGGVDLMVMSIETSTFINIDIVAAGFLIEES